MVEQTKPQERFSENPLYLLTDVDNATLFAPIPIAAPDGITVPKAYGMKHPALDEVRELCGLSETALITRTDDVIANVVKGVKETNGIFKHIYGDLLVLSRLHSLSDQNEQLQQRLSSLDVFLQYVKEAHGNLSDTDELQLIAALGFASQHMYSRQRMKGFHLHFSENFPFIMADHQEGEEWMYAGSYLGMRGVCVTKQVYETAQKYSQMPGLPQLFLGRQTYTFEHAPYLYHDTTINAVAGILHMNQIASPDTLEARGGKHVAGERILHRKKEKGLTVYASQSGFNAINANPLFFDHEEASFIIDENAYYTYSLNEYLRQNPTVSRATVEYRLARNMGRLPVLPFLDIDEIMKLPEGERQVKIKEYFTLAKSKKYDHRVEIPQSYESYLGDVPLSFVLGMAVPVVYLPMFKEECERKNIPVYALEAAKLLATLPQDFGVVTPKQSE